MARGHSSAKYYMFIVLAVWLGEVPRAEAVASQVRLAARRVDRNVAMHLRSHGEATLLQHSNRSRDLLPGFCSVHADCKHSGMCDITGSSGCGNRCLSVPDPQGRRHCMATGLGGVCANGGECLSARCDTNNFYGCLNLCVSEHDSAGRHCRTRGMGEPCDNNKQCLSGVCDTKSYWGCRDLCVSELDAAGYNRHCDPKRVGETCAHHENCAQGSVCDLDGSIEDSGRCRNKCATQSVKGCERQHCSPNCPLCLSNLLLQEHGVAPNQWNGYPAHRVERNANTKAVRMWLDAPETTQLSLRIPASCVDPLPCVEVKGTLEVAKLNGARLHIQSGLFTGFPGAKPNVNVVTDGKCPLRSDGFPLAGDTSCCYASESVANCTSSAYGKGCENFFSGSVLYGGDGWGWERRDSQDPDSFDQSTSHNRFVRGNLSAPGTSQDFSIEIDFSAEKYKHFQFAGSSWNMNEPLMKFSRDRNCNHINDWPEASLEFSIRLQPPEAAKTKIDAEVKLTHFEVNRKKSCTITRS